MTVVQLNAPEIILKLLEVYKRLIKFMPGCECRSRVLLSYWPEFLHNTFPLLPAAHIPMCYILPELLPVHARNRLTPVYAG